MPDGSKPDTPRKSPAKSKRTTAPAKRTKPFVSPYGGLRGTVLYCADLTETTAREWTAIKRRR
jgi:hypothetical protein